MSAENKLLVSFEDAMGCISQLGFAAARIAKRNKLSPEDRADLLLIVSGLLRLKLYVKDAYDERRPLRKRGREG